MLPPVVVTPTPTPTTMCSVGRAWYLKLKPDWPRNSPTEPTRPISPTSSGSWTDAAASAMPTPPSSRWISRLVRLNSALTWPRLTASVGLTPGATLVKRRSLPGVPNDTVFGAVATDPAPIATELFAPAWTCAPLPSATLFGASALD